MATGASENILRIKRSDDDGDYVLLNISGNGSSPLDLRLLATEGENPYVMDIRQSRISRLRDKKSEQSDAEWESTLLSTLLQHRSTPNSSATNSDEKLEIIASLGDAKLSIVFRKNISGITQRLGEILLTQNAELELDTISWISTAVQRSTALEQEVQDLSLKYELANQTIASLNKQLEDLITAKQSHEDALLGKFKTLLNAKKMKIRDQQRLLAGAKIDRKRGEKVQAAGTTTKSRTPEQSRKGKRKATVPEKNEGEDDEDAFERPSSPPVKQEGDLSDEPLNTPEASDDDVTEDDDDDDDNEDLGVMEGIEAPHGNSNGGDGQRISAGHGTNDAMKVDTPPPTRELPPTRDLPFGKPSKQETKPAQTQRSSTLQQQEAGNEDEETDDDEL